MSNNVLFITEKTLKARLPMSAAIDFTAVKPFIKLAQDQQVQPILGSGLYLRLQEGIVANNLNTDELDLLNDYITDTIIWFTMAMLPIGMGYQLFSKGFLQKSAEESNTPSRGDLELLEERYKKHGEYYATRMIKYLQENYQKHYTYLNPGSGVDVIFPVTRAYTSPIFLGRYFKPEDGKQYGNGGSDANALPIYYTAAPGISTFTITQLVGRVVLAATRSGLGKVVTTSVTSNPDFIQIVSGVVTLPTGDVIGVDGENFIFLYR
jgi:hypothetical protein